MTPIHDTARARDPVLVSHLFTEIFHPGGRGHGGS